jgi:nucleoside-diphosphate-sugar epimerase/glycosyltransferase involved in cell wall biosynthesis
MMDLTVHLNDTDALRAEIARLDGPVLVLGASGFVGANLLQTLLSVRRDVYGTASRKPAWRLETIPDQHVRIVDLLIESNVDVMLGEVKPRTVFNCVAFGAYSFETESRLVYETNFSFLTRLLPKLQALNISSYVHAGSSSEYGDNCSGPTEDACLQPNSHYAVSKAAAAGLISYYGRHLRLPCANLRLYSVYGPLEDSSRLIPAVVRSGLNGTLPEFVRADISRDYVYIDDVVRAFVLAATRLQPADYGASLNIGTGRCVSMQEMAEVARQVFGVTAAPRFTMAGRPWDTANWYAQPALAEQKIGWRAQVDLEQGLRSTARWMQTLPDPDAYQKSSKKFALDTRCSITAVIACYKDCQAIPIMYQRLKAVFARLNLDHEIVFVNDCSPDDSEEVIRRISSDDPRVIGISHSRNFGSQAAFMSGLRLASKNGCVLLDGDLQDPPELIEQFVGEWRKGFDVVYGRRVKRDATLFMQFAYKAFYRVFDYFSYVPVPHDAGDFSLLDRKVVNALIQFPERDLFLRGLRAFAGFRQTGVDYHRPERMFGRSTNNLLKNFGWAKKGILSFSNTPLNMLSVAGLVLLVCTVLLAVVQVILRVFRPDSVPQGLTTVLLAIMFFGSLSILSTAIVGEYIAKIFEEVKRRPLFIRRSVVRNGQIRQAVSESQSEMIDDRA